MKKISTLAVLLALLAAPIVMAGGAEEGKAGKSCCAGKASQAAAKTCDPANCDKKGDKCTAAEKAKCPMHADTKTEAKAAPKAPAAPKS